MNFRKFFIVTLSLCLVMGLGSYFGCTNIEVEQDNPETAQTIAALQKQVQALEDLEAVKQLHIRYVNGLTYGDWEDVVACFTQDARLAVFMGQEPIVGIDAIRDAFMNQIATSDKHVGREANLTLHPLITMDGNRATGNWVIYFITQPNPDEPTIQLVQGIYDMEYEKENGEWKIDYIKWVARFALGPTGVLPEEGPPGEMGGAPGGPGGPPPGPMPSE